MATILQSMFWKIIFFIGMLTVGAGCQRRDPAVEWVLFFKQNETLFQACVLVADSYLLMQKDSFAKRGSVYFINCGQGSSKNLRGCNDSVSYFLTALNMFGLQVEKNQCSSREAFDEYWFQVNGEPHRDSDLYLIYSKCERNIQPTIHRKIRVIPINKYWHLLEEK